MDDWSNRAEVSWYVHRNERVRAVHRFRGKNLPGKRSS